MEKHLVLVNSKNDLQELDLRQKMIQQLDYEFFANFESEHTRKSYRKDIQQFLELITTDFPEVDNFSKVERAHVVYFRNKLSESQMAPKTINRKLSSVSSYFDFLTEKQIVAFNPCESVKRPRQEVKTPTNDLTDEEVVALFEAIDGNKTAGKLHKAILVTLFTTGIRKSELINLRFRDLRNLNGHSVIEIRAKGGKMLTKVLHPVCVEVLDEYFGWMRENGREIYDTDWVFRPTKNPSDPGNLDRKLNPKAIDYIVKTYAKKANIFKRISAHSARATYIGSALQNGMSLWKIAQDVGHSSVKTTEMYNKRKLSLEESPVFNLGFVKKAS